MQASWMLAEHGDYGSAVSTATDYTHCRKTMAHVVLKHKKPPGFKAIGGEGRQLQKRGQSIRGVGKDEIEAAPSKLTQERGDVSALKDALVCHTQ